MTYSALHKRLLPGIDEIKAYDIEACFMPIEEEFAKEFICSQQRFHHRIYTRLMALYDIDLDVPNVSFEKEHILQATARLPEKQMFQAIGLCWYSLEVAQDMIRPVDQRKLNYSEFEKSDIVFAISNRNKFQTRHSSNLNENSIIDEGLKCFAAWIHNMPDQVQGLLLYYYANQGFVIPELSQQPDDEQDLREKICAIWAQSCLNEQIKQEGSAQNEKMSA